MRIVLFDLPEDRIKLYPLTLTRPTCYLRVGILTLIEKWQHDFPDAEISIATDTYLSPKFGLPNPEKSLWVHSGLIPDAHVLSSLKSLEQGEKLVKNSLWCFRWTRRMINIAFGMDSVFPWKPRVKYFRRADVLNNLIFHIFQNFQETKFHLNSALAQIPE